MIQSFQRITVLLLLLVASLFIYQPQANAEEQVTTWGISPANENGPDSRVALQYVLSPGQTQSDYVVVTNYSDKPISLKLYPGDALLKTGNGFDIQSEDETSSHVGIWVKTGVSELQLQARESKVVPVLITVPEDASPGDYVGGLLASYLKENDTESAQLNTEHRVGVRVELRVSGPIDPQIVISNPRVEAGQSLNPFAKQPLQISFEVENTGNVRLEVSPKITIKGPFGWGEQVLEIPKFEDLLPKDSVTVKQEINSWPFGPMELTIEADAPSSIGQSLIEMGISTEESVHFWMFPWGWVIFGGLAVGLGVFALFGIKKLVVLKKKVV